MKKSKGLKQTAAQKVLNFMRQSKANRFLVGYATFFGTGMLIYFSIVSLIIPTYFAFAPARSFVDYYYARVADTPVGTEPQMTLCRRINYDAIRIEAVRTFIYVDKGGKEEQVKDYPFNASVSQGESDSNCITVRLKGQPQVPGTYRTVTSITFSVQGHRKSYSYDSNQYKMIEVEQTDDERIKELQRQIDAIKEDQSPGTTQSAPSSQPAPTQQQQTAQNSTNNTSKQQNQSSSGGSSGNSGGNNGSGNGDTDPGSDPGLLGTVNQILNGLGL